MTPPAATVFREDEQPYFLWWTTCTVRELREHLCCGDPARIAYWLGALLREANSRDVWQFTSRKQVEGHWPDLQRHLGPSCERWTWLLQPNDKTSVHA